MDRIFEDYVSSVTGIEEREDGGERMKGGKEQGKTTMDRIFEDYVSSATVQPTSHDAFLKII